MELTERIFKITNIDQLVEQLSHIFQKSIIIENENFELIAYSSPNEYSFDPVQQKTILTKRCPLYIIERLKKEGIVKKLKEQDKPIRINPLEDIGFFQRTVISLKHNGHIYGYLWIYEANEVFKEEELLFLEKIAPHLGSVIHDKQLGSKHDRESIIWKLINHDYLNQAQIEREASIASYVLPNEFTVLVASVKDPTLLHLLGKMKELFDTFQISYYLGKGTDIVGIIHGDERISSSDRVKRLLDEIEKSLTSKEKIALFVGIGHGYERITDMRKSYLEALEVIETMFFLNVKDQSMYYFNQLGMYRYAKMMYKKNVSEHYKNNNIVQLIKKDIENKSELLKTLWYFLENDCKVGQTAEKLFIHPNTLNYRIKQITDVTNIDFSNVHEKVELYTQLLMYYYVPDYQDFYHKDIY